MSRRLPWQAVARATPQTTSALATCPRCRWPAGAGANRVSNPGGSVRIAAWSEIPNPAVASSSVVLRLQGPAVGRFKLSGGSE